MRTALAVVLTASATWMGAFLASPKDDVAQLQARVLRLEQALAGDLSVSSLSIPDQDGRTRVMLGTHASSGEPFITLLDREGFTRLDLRLNHGDAPYVALRDPSSTRIRLEAPSVGAAGLGVWGKGRLNDRSHAGLWIWDDQTIAFGGGLRSAGEGTFHLQTEPTGKTTLALRTASGLETFRAPEQ